MFHNINKYIFFSIEKILVRDVKKLKFFQGRQMNTSLSASVAHGNWIKTVRKCLMSSTNK